MEKEEKTNTSKEPAKKSGKSDVTKFLVLLVAAIIAGAFIAKNAQGPNNPEETKSEIATPSNATATPGNAEAAPEENFLSADQGNSEEYYRPENNEQVIINIGTGNYDISDAIVKWEFGEPIVNILHAADILGLEVVTTVPKNFEYKPRYEVYAPGEDPDTINRRNFFIIGDDGQYVRYTVTSRLVEDSTGNQISTIYPCSIEDDELLIAASSLPYYDGHALIVGNGASYNYGESSIVMSINDPAADEPSSKEEEGGEKDVGIMETETTTEVVTETTQE